MNKDIIRRVYKRYAPGYNIYFGKALGPGREQAVRQMRFRSGDHVLEVGVGTGLSLPLYPPEVTVTGIDLSPDMLRQAERLRRSLNLDNVEDLQVMDAEEMAFADNSFDKVVAMYVVSVVENPVRFVDEMRRVCRPDGEIIIVNHFQHSAGIVAFFERLAAPLASVLGFDPAFNLDAFVSETALEVTERIPVNWLGYWTMLRARNNKINLAYCDDRFCSCPPWPQAEVRGRRHDELQLLEKAGK